MKKFMLILIFFLINNGTKACPTCATKPNELSHLETVNFPNPHPEWKDLMSSHMNLKEYIAANYLKKLNNIDKKPDFFKLIK